MKPRANVVTIPKEWEEIVRKMVSGRYHKAINSILRGIGRIEKGVSVERLMDYLTRKAPNLRSATFCEYRKAAIWFAHACGWDAQPLTKLVQIEIMPEGVERPRKIRKRSIEQERIKALAQKARRIGDNQLFVAIQLANHYGMRMAELPNLDVVRLQSGGYALFIQGAKKTENRGSNRTLPIVPKEVKSYLQAIKLLKGCDTELLRKRLFALDKKLYPRLKHRVTFHRIRHQVASDLKLSGVSLEQIGAQLGHRKLKATEHYGNRRHGRRRRTPIEVIPEFPPRPYEPHPARARKAKLRPAGLSLKPR